MEKNLIVILLAFALLVSGCIAVGGTTETQEEVSDDTTEQEEEEQETGEAEGETAENETDEEEEETDGEVDLTGLDYLAVLSLGVPVECDITVTDQGETTTVKLYAQGEDQIRWESEMEEIEGCTKFIYIQKADSVYFGCEGGNYPPGSSCNWLQMTVEEGDYEEYDEESYETSFETYDYEFEALSSTQIACKPWLYDASKFETPGNVCDMDTYIEEMMQQYTY